MNKTRTTAFLLVLIFLVVAAVTFIFLSSLDKGDTPDNIVIVAPSAEPAAADNSSATAPTTPPDNAATVTLAPAVSEPAPAATPAVVEPTPVPSSNTEPTPAPSATPVPAETYGKPLGSGSFTSDTGAKINIVADWVAMTSGKDTVDVKVTVSVISYSLYIAAFPNSVDIGLNGQYVSLGAPAINYDGPAQRTSPLADYTFTINLADGQSASLPLSVEWHFRGSYGEVQIDSIECGGVIPLSR